MTAGGGRRAAGCNFFLFFFFFLFFGSSIWRKDTAAASLGWVQGRGGNPPMRLVARRARTETLTACPLSSESMNWKRAGGGRERGQPGGLFG